MNYFTFLGTLFGEEFAMRIAVFGVGGVGGYFGWRLTQAGEDVVFVARGENFRVLSTHGLTMDTPDGKTVVQPVQVVEDPAEVGPVDAVLLGVKAWQVPEAAHTIRPFIGPETFVVPLQNGVEAPFQVAEVLGWKHAFGGLCYIVALKIGPGHIRHAGMEPYVAFGEFDQGAGDRGRLLEEAFLRAKVKVEIPGDIQAAMWEKFLFIASLSGVAAITRAPVGVVRSVPETRLMLEEIMKEICSVAIARNIQLKNDAINSTMSIIDRLPPATTTSLQRDIMEGRPSELLAHNAAVARLGMEVGLPVPLNSFIYRSLLPLELCARGKVTF
jgi:2-dehydropantoate 2-reductase